MAISYDTLNKLQWCNLNPNDTLVDLEDSAFAGLYNGGWSTRPNLPPTITLSDTINFVLDKKSTFAVKQLGEFLKSQDVSLTDMDEVPDTALKNAIAKASDKYIDGRIVQVTGQNKDKIMSQKAVTDYMKSMSDDIDNNLKVNLDSLQTEVDNVSIVANNAIPNNKKTSELGTSTDLVATQKLVNDVNTKAVNAQTKADQAHSLATTANDTANAKWSPQETVGSGDIVRKSVTDDLSNRTTTAQNTANDAKSIANGKWSPQDTIGTGRIVRESVTNDLSGRITTAQNTANTAKNTADQALAKANAGGGLGYGQRWQNVTGSRSRGTTYTNNTGKPIMVNITAGSQGQGGSNLYIDGLDVGNINLGIGAVMRIIIIVPVNSTYKYNGNSSSGKWLELR